MGSEPRRLSAMRDLPETYSPIWRLDLTKNPRAALALNLISLPLFALFGCVFSFISYLTRPDILSRLHGALLLGWPISVLLTFLGAVIGIMILHEAIHGAFFWVYTRSRPVFGLRLLFAYAGAPEWHIPRDAYAVIGLAPIVLISVAGLIVIPFVSLAAAQFTLLIITVNASGAVGDLYVVGKTMRQARTVLIQDTGAGFTMFGEVESAGVLK